MTKSTTTPKKKVSKKTHQISDPCIFDPKYRQLEISKVAYDLFVKRGSVHGYALEDWLRAESIIDENAAKSW